MKKHSGFTLVELSIVVIVIGLLSGAIIKGQGIIKNAKLKRIASDYSNVATAIYTYEDRYEQLPGDDASSVIATSMPDRGNEDGIISVNESKMVIRHLRKADLLKGDSESGVLSHALNGKIHVVYGRQANELPSANTKLKNNIRTTSVCFDGVKAEDAKTLDFKNDDGKYNKGSVQSGNNYEDLESTLTLCFEI